MNPKNSDTSLLLPMPGSPTTVASWIDDSLSALRKVFQEIELEVTPDERRARARSRSIPKRLLAATARHTWSGRGFPLTLTGSGRS